MMGSDSIGIQLLAAFTSTSWGACDKSFDKNLAVSIPPRFLLPTKKKMSFYFTTLNSNSRK
jgi:hypothetical protein